MMMRDVGDEDIMVGDAVDPASPRDRVDVEGSVCAWDAEEDGMG